MKPRSAIFSLYVLFLGCSPKIQHIYTLQEKDLVPEGIAYSKKENAFFLTSIAKSKIIRVDRKSGEQTDFIRNNEYGYAPGAGIIIDEEQNALYAIGGYYRRPDSLTSLYKFDLVTKKLIHRYNIEDKGEHYLNDLALDQKGNLYLTDTKGASIYFLERNKDSLRLFYRSKEIEFPNGITLSDDGTKIYIASTTKGVRVLEISSKKIMNGIDTLGISQGIDGLKFKNGHLFAVQNGSRKNEPNFRKLILNKEQDNIVGHKVIDSGHPNLSDPLTLCFMEKRAVVIGTSNLRYYDQENSVFMDAESIPQIKLVVYTAK